jgi:acyl carrier protein
MNDITQQVIKIIADELHLKLEAVTEDKVLKDDLGVESLEALELLIALEDEFHVVYPEDSHEHIKTVQDVIDLTRKLLKT